jgi:hypothetical protein
MLRSVGAKAQSALIYAGLGAAWLVILVLAAHLLNLRATRTLLPEDIWVWGSACILFVVWIVPLSFAHKHVMKRLRQRTRL